MIRTLAVTLAVVSLFADVCTAADWRFELTFSKSVRSEPYTGRAYVFFSKRRVEPRTGPGWFQPDPFVALDVVEWKPDTPVVISSESTGLRSFPKPLGELDLAGMRAQAVVRFDTWSRNVGTGPGNGFGKVITLPNGPPEQAVPLSVDELVPPPAFRETSRRKLCEVRSRLLSEFHHRDVLVRGAVTLPAEYESQPERRYPVVFYVPGFGGTLARPPHLGFTEADQPVIQVVLDPSCPLGHHVFADSANNGPWGTALVEEWLPEFDRRFRTIPKPTARFLTGHSSGGWATLWMQVTHPDVFGGTWSTAPDPVDFRDFQRIDLYDSEDNVYRDAKNEPRPLGRANGRVLIWYRDFDQMEHALGHGGQLHSFEAAFSPRGEDGRPRRAWSRETGKIDTRVTEQWKKYDVRRKLEAEWDTLGPKLDGKLHVVMGTEDTFYLEGATRLLKESLEELKSDAVVEMVPGRDHMNLLTPDLKTRIRREMTAAFRRHHDWPPAD